VSILGKRGNWLRVSSFEVFAAESMKIPFLFVNDAEGMCKGLSKCRGSVVPSTSYHVPLKRRSHYLTTKSRYPITVWFSVGCSI